MSPSLSFSISPGSRGYVAWIQQKASMASVFTPDLNMILVIRVENKSDYTDDNVRVPTSSIAKVCKRNVEQNVYKVCSFKNKER